MRRAFLYAMLLMLILGLWRVKRVFAGSESPQAMASSKSGTATPAGYAGAEACATCHETEVKKFSGNPHARMPLQHGSNGITCENCHGPGQAHIDAGGDAAKIFQFSKATEIQVDAKCLSCHAEAHPNFERTAHGEALVGCTSCHAIHGAKSEEHLLKAAQPQLCYGCHTDVKASFAQPFHHRVDEGLMNCNDCHNPHGTFQPQMVKLSATQDSICTKCHIDTAGPWLYEHPPIKTEGCTSCHFPHGATNPQLLTQNNVNILCMQCHSPSMNFTAPGAPSFHNQANQYQACTVCHVQIHGSNASNVFFK